MLFHFKGFKRHFAALYIRELVNSWIRGFVFWCHEQVNNISLLTMVKNIWPNSNGQKQFVLTNHYPKIWINCNCEIRDKLLSVPTTGQWMGKSFFNEWSAAISISILHHACKSWIFCAQKFWPRSIVAYRCCHNIYIGTVSS